MFEIGFIASIFNGYKVEGICGTIISLGLATLLAFVAARIAKNPETLKPPLERQKAKYRICRILHYSFLELTLVSSIISFATYSDSKPNSISDGFRFFADSVSPGDDCLYSNKSKIEKDTEKGTPRTGYYSC